MKKILFILLFAVSLSAENSPYTILDFGGMVTDIAADKIADKYSPDMLNVYTDDKGMVTKRRGTVLINSSGYEGIKPIRNLGVYPLNSITSYLTINSSNSWSYLLNGIPTAIANGLTISALDDYTVAKGLMYRDNGVDGLGGKWDGTTYTPITVLNSTQMVSGVYIKYWNNRLWKIGKNSSVAYYSKVNDPEYFDTTYQYVNVNITDGDIITGLMIWNDRLIATKKYAVYEIYESQPGVFLVRRLYDGIGCLYNTTMDVLPDGLPVWMSHRGVEEFTGNSFNLLSESNDEYFKSLPQLGDATLSYTETTKAQWDAGSSIGLDTTTIVDSFIVRLSTRVDQLQDTWNAVNSFTSSSWQEFQTSNTARLQCIEVYGDRFGAFTLSSGDISGVGYSITPTWNVDEHYELLNFYPYNVILTSGTTYRITHTVDGVCLLVGQGGNPYKRGESIYTHLGLDWDWYFKIYLVSPTTSSYTSSITNINSLGLNSWTSWNSLNATCNIPTGVGYYVRVATATEVIKDAPYTATGNGALINLTTGPFIQYRIETTSPTMQIDDVTITASGEASKPYGKVFDRRYWLAVTTNTSTWSNSVVLCYQKNNEWTQFNNMNISCLAIMKNELYYGDSTATGNIYKTDVSNIWQDNGANYNSYWRSKIFDFGGPMSDKLFKTMWVYAEPVTDGDRINIKYALNGTNTFTSKIFPTYATGQTSMLKIPFEAWTKGYQIQFEIGDNDNHDFRFKRLDLLYEGLQPR